MARAFKRIRDDGGLSAVDRDQLRADVEACIARVNDIAPSTPKAPSTEN
jgi:hypothetical protein